MGRSSWFRVISSVFFGVAAFGFSWDLQLVAAASAGIQLPVHGLVMKSIGTGLVVFAGLTLRDIAKGIDREH